jgi:hypothetical protein
VKDNHSRAEITANRIDVRGVVMILAFVALSAATVLAEGRLFRFFFAITGACGLGVAIVLQIRERIRGSIAGAAIKDDLRHPGRTKIHDVGGLLLVALSVTAVLVGMPTVWYFFALAIGAGVVVAAVMHRAHD